MYLKWGDGFWENGRIYEEYVGRWTPLDLSSLSNRINHRSAHTCDNHIFQPRLVRGKRIHWNAKDIYGTKIHIPYFLCVSLVFNTLLHYTSIILNQNMKFRDTWAFNLHGWHLFTWSISLDWGLFNWSSRSSLAQFDQIYKMSTRAPFLSNCTHLLMNIPCIYIMGNVQKVW